MWKYSSEPFIPCLNIRIGDVITTCITQRELKVHGIYHDILHKDWTVCKYGDPALLKFIGIRETFHPYIIKDLCKRCMYTT